MKDLFVQIDVVAHIIICIGKTIGVLVGETEVQVPLVIPLSSQFSPQSPSPPPPHPLEIGQRLHAPRAALKRGSRVRTRLPMTRTDSIPAAKSTRERTQHQSLTGTSAISTPAFSIPTSATTTSTVTTTPLITIPTDSQSVLTSTVTPDLSTGVIGNKEDFQEIMMKSVQEALKLHKKEQMEEIRKEKLKLERNTKGLEKKRKQREMASASLSSAKAKCYAVSGKPGKS